MAQVDESSEEIVIELENYEEDEVEYYNPSPEEKAGLISRIFYFWATRLFILTKRKNKQGEELENHDLFDLTEYDKTERLTERFDVKWEGFMSRLRSNPEVEAKNTASQLKWSIWNVIRFRMILAGFLKFLNSSVQFGYPLIIQGLLTYIQNIDTAPSYEGYVWVGALALSLILKGIIENAYFWMVQRAGWQVRSIISTSVFKKSLRLTSSARQTMSQGQIVNLMQLDSTKLENFCSQFHVLWDGVFQIAGYTAIIYSLIGESVFIGLGVMLVAMPIQVFVSMAYFKYFKKVAVLTDTRVKVTNELLQSILGVKMAAWETNFKNNIKESRGKELGILKKSFLLNAFSTAYMSAVPAITAVAAISHYALTNGTIEASILFAALQGFDSLRFPLLFYPMAITSLVEALVSQGRLARFMALDENKPLRDRNQKEIGTGYEGPVIEIVSGEFFWADPDKPIEITPEKERKKSRKSRKNEIDILESVPEVVAAMKTPALEDIDITINNGELVGIIGNVGSGKSSLLSAIIGELHQTNGTTTVSGTISYSTQSAWILNMTLRENILFGQPFEEDRYWDVIRVCQLEHDLETLQDGDQTIIGERGINLSGGQAQRVSVARAAYAKTDIVILDDPLSALDPEVAAKLFKECIVDFMTGRTRVIVTNQLNFLPQCDHIVALNGGDQTRSDNGLDEDGESDVIVNARVPGSISEQGTYSELLSSGLDFSSLMNKFNGSASDSEPDLHENRQESVVTVEVDGNDADESQKQKPQEDVKSHKLMQVEERAKGAVELKEYLAYIRSGSYFLFIVSISLLLLNQTVSLGNRLVITFWSDDADYENNPLEVYLIIYAGTAVGVAIFSFIRTAVFLYFGLNASRNLHEKLLNGIIRAPMSFFDTTPTGRIVSRFNKDIFSIDVELPRIFQFFLFTVTIAIFSLATVIYTAYYFAAGIPVLFGIYYIIIQYYRPTARDCKRLEAISRSPVYAHFGEVINGLSSIRSYGREASFIHDNAGKVDQNLKSAYNVKIVERWLALRLELLASIIAAFAGVMIVYVANEGDLSAGFAGLAITFILSLTGLLGQTVRMFVQVEAGMNSVERVNHYGEDIEKEAPFESSNPPPKSWPSSGAIEIRDLTMRYRPNTPLVLKGVNVDIPGGSVGVVGRTGCGKSSLMLTLLRIVEAEKGYIKIDGIDISTIGLHELRKKVSIVPQNPVIFSGTVRNNLDPFNEHSEKELWNALEQTSMRPAIEELENGLDEEVAEYGENFSQGQRQLLCMSRSLLQNAKILLLDEATSSVDYETDALIQKTIRQNFVDCTILTIAHRIQTVIDNDAILVMEAGTVAEYGKPSELLADRNSTFSSIVAEMGPEMEAQMRKMAK